MYPKRPRESVWGGGENVSPDPAVALNGPARSIMTQNSDGTAFKSISYKMCRAICSLRNRVSKSC